jgi:hypothetical protein
VIGVRDLNVAIDRYRKMFELPATELQDDDLLQLHLAAFAGTPVVLASPLRNGSPLARHLDKFGEAPYLFILQMAPKAGGITGAGSKWFGRAIIWDFSIPDHPWIGMRTPAAQ